MRGVFLSLRFIVLMAVPTLPVLALVYFLFGPLVLSLLVGLMVAFVLGVMVLAERFVCKAVDADGEFPKKLEKTSFDAFAEVSDLPELLHTEHSAHPRFLVYRDPAPNGMAVKSIAGPGTVLLSQGLVALLSEAELRSVLRTLTWKCRQPGAVYSTFSGVIATWILRMAPQGWARLVYSAPHPKGKPEEPASAFSALFFIVLYPIANYFLFLGSSGSDSLNLAYSFPKTGATMGTGAFNSAMHKLGAAWSALRFPGFRHLYLLSHPIQ